MKQVARNLTMEGWGFLEGRQYLIIDRDTKFTPFFRPTIAGAGTKVIRLPPYSLNLNAYCERWILSVKSEALSRLVLFGEQALRQAFSKYVDHYHEERNHQGKGNVLLFPSAEQGRGTGSVPCRERLGGMLKFYFREAASRLRMRFIGSCCGNGLRIRKNDPAE
jgi:hypothetical protein